MTSDKELNQSSPVRETQRQQDTPESSCFAYAKTTLKSSNVRHAARCKLTGRTEHDVVFAKESSLELRRLTPEGNLLTVLDQPVFGCIRDMKVLHCLFEERIPRENAEQPGDETVKNATAHNNKNKVSVTGDDILVMTSDSGMLSFLSFEHPTRLSDCYPPIAMHEYAAGRFSIVQELYISEPGLDFRGVGHSIAVDPLSRSIAVSALQDNLLIFLMNWEGSGREFRAPLERRVVHREGTIWCTTFLYPSLAERDRIVLAVLMSDDIDHTFSLVFYEFFASLPLKAARVWAEVVVGRGINTPLPLHLIALPHHPGCVVLINEKHACFVRAEDIAAGESFLNSYILPCGKENVITAYALPPMSHDLTTADASSFSTEYTPDPYSFTTQYFYMSDDSNGLYRVNVTAEPEIEFLRMVESTSAPGVHSARVGGAVAASCMVVLRCEDDGGDLLAVLGEMGDGAVCLAQYSNVTGRAPMETTCRYIVRSVIPNWTSMLDMMPANIHQRRGGKLRNRHDLLFVPGGKDSSGCVREIRNGIALTKGGGQQEGHDGFGGVNGIWNLAYRPGVDVTDTFLAISFVGETRMMHLGAGGLEDISESSGMDIDVETLCCTAIPGLAGKIAQIHRGGIVIATPSVEASSQNGSQLHAGGDESENSSYIGLQTTTPSIHWSPSEDGHILLSAVSGRDVCLIVSRGTPENGVAVSLVWGRLQGTEEARDDIFFQVVTEHHLEDDPCCMNIVEARPDLGFPAAIVIIGTHQPALLFYKLVRGPTPGNCRIDRVHQQTLERQIESPMTAAAEGTNVPQSTIVLCRERISYLIAGLRDGTVLYYSWNWDSERDQPILSDPEIRSIGVLPIQLIPSRPEPRPLRSPAPSTFEESRQMDEDVEMEDLEEQVVYGTSYQESAILLSELPWRIGFLNSGRLWFSCIAIEERGQTDDNTAALSYATPFAYGEDVELSRDSSRSEEGFMFVSRNQLHFVHVARTAGNIVRSIHVRNTPRRVFYDASTKKLLVACDLTGTSHPTSVLRVVDPTSGRVLAEERMRDREAIYAMTEWIIQDKRKYRYIVIGTGQYDAGKVTATHGRLLIYNLKHRGSRYEIKLVWQMERHGGAVYCIKPYLTTHLLVSCGKSVQIFNLEFQSKKLIEVCRHDMRWPVTSISSNGFRICIGTQKESLTVLEYDPGAGVRVRVRGTGRHARLTADCLMVTEDLAIGTDKIGGVFGLEVDKEASVENCLNDVFSLFYGETVQRLAITSLVHRTAEDEGVWEKGWPVPSQSANNTDSLSGTTERTTAILGCTLSGSLLSLMNLTGETFAVLKTLEPLLAEYPKTRPLAGNIHDRYRSLPSTKSSTEAVDGDLVCEFLRLSRQDQLHVVQSSVTLRCNLHKLFMGRKDILSRSVSTAGTEHEEFALEMGRNRYTNRAMDAENGEVVDAGRGVDILVRVLEDLELGAVGG